MAYDSPIHATLTQLSLCPHLHPPLSMQCCATQTGPRPWKPSSTLFRRIDRGHSFCDHPTSTSSPEIVYSRASSTPTAPSSVTKLAGSFADLSNVGGSTSTRHSSPSSSLALFTSCYIWRPPATGLSTNSTSRTHSCTVSWPNGLFPPTCQLRRRRLPRPCLPPLQIAIRAQAGAKSLVSAILQRVVQHWVYSHELRHISLHLQAQQRHRISPPIRR
jgi:hypothetical protein